MVTDKNHETDKQSFKQMLEENNLTIEEAMEMSDKAGALEDIKKRITHNLRCSHSYNWGSRVEYNMPCLILKELPNNRAKILVFGNRRKKLEYCDLKELLGRIRYVSKNKLKSLEVKNK